MSSSQSRYWKGAAISLVLNQPWKSFHISSDQLASISVAV